MDAKPIAGFAPFGAAEKRRRMAAQNDQSGYFALLGLRLLDLEPGYARMELPFRAALTHSAGVVQGGLIATLADSCIAHAAIAALGSDGRRTTTIELKINYIRPATGAAFTAAARLLHLGRRTAVGEAEVTDERGRLVAKCLASLMVLPPGGAGTPPGEPE